MMDDLTPYLSHPNFIPAAAGIVVLLIVLLAVLVRRRLVRGRVDATGEAPATVSAEQSPWVAGLSKTRSGMVGRLLQSWRGPNEKDAWLSEVEEILLSSDVGVHATRALVESLRTELKEASDPSALKAILQNAVRHLLAGDSKPRVIPSDVKPWVILVVGVNGVGKTTTIGKLAHRFHQQGKKVLLIAGDTFRAAASEQLTIWAERTESEIVKHQHGADPAAVVFDGMKAAQARGADVVLIDTAGRLHVKAHLMEELKKITRTIGRHMEGAPHEVLLVVDATTGQNALNQARVFNEATRLDGVALTKLDGTAKGGVALAIRSELGVPITYVGLGERAEDLAPFDPDEFTAALFAENSVTP